VLAGTRATSFITLAGSKVPVVDPLDAVPFPWSGVPYTREPSAGSPDARRALGIDGADRSELDDLRG